MGLLVSHKDKTTFTSDPFTIATGGTLHFRTWGNFGRGAVRLLIKVDDNTYQPFVELTMRELNRAAQVALLTGDMIKFEFSDCLGASAELRS